MLVEGIDFRIGATDYEWMALFDRQIENETDKTVLKTSAGCDICPGDHITKVHGQKTSAGFSRLNLRPGWSMEYIGLLEGDTKPSSLALFNCYLGGTKQNGEKPKLDLMECMEQTQYFYQAFSYVQNKNECVLIYSTPANSARVIQTDCVEFVNRKDSYA